MNIRLAQIEELPQIIEVLNKTTLHLIEKGIKQWIYPWSTEKIAEEIGDKRIYVLVLDNQLIGTFSLNYIDHLSELIIEPQSIYLSQIAISPNFQGKNLGNKIVSFACSLAQDFNKPLYLDCWAGNEKLKTFYSKAGLDYLGDFPEEDYLIGIFKYNDLSDPGFI